jgi:tetratricopeptide (TPR) repeat protein
MGLPDLTLAAARRAVELDPLSYIDRSNLAIYSISSGNLKEATRLARDALALQPGNVGALAVLCETLAAAKQFDEAKRILAQIASLTADDPRVGDRAACQFWIAAYSGNKTVSRQIVEEVALGYPGNGVPAGDMSTGYRVIGDNDKALEWYVRALDDRDIAVLPTRYFAKGPREVFETPEWIKARKRPDVIAWENARARIAREFGSKISGS